MDLMTSALPTEPTRSLNGPERVAALLLAVDKYVAQRVLKHFDQDELRQITRYAAGLGSVPVSTIEPLIEEFMEMLTHGGLELRGSVGQAEQLLTGVIPPDQIAEIMSDVLGSPNSAIWERVSNVPEAVFANYIAKEHPQTAALILSRVNPTCAAKALAAFSEGFRNDLMRRMLSMRAVSDDAVRLVEGILQDELVLNTDLSASAAKNAKLAAIINKLERDQAEGVLKDLSEYRPREAEALKGLLFTFEDIVRLNSRARMILFDTVPADRVVLALRGAGAELREAVLSSLSSRVRRMVEAELSSGASPPRRDILQARRTIAETVLKLAEQGKIDLSNSAEDADE